VSGLTVQDLDVRLGGTAVLRGVTAAFRAGEVTAVVGPNGAGKSTLLETLVGLRRPDGGQVTLDGEGVLAMRPRLRARRLGFLAQSPEVAWSVTVRTFVGLGRTARLGPWGLGAEDCAIVERALDAAGLQMLAERVVTSLSGGERARVFVARALAGEPDWLIADEPLTGLDPGHSLDTVALFRDLAAAGAGVVVSLHDLSVAARAADRVIVLAAGRIVADGSPAQCLAPQTLRAAYGVEARVVPGEIGPLIEVLRRAD